MNILSNTVIDVSQLKAIGDEVIVLVDEMPLRSEFIICPEFGGRKPVTGKVISIGNRVEYASVGERLFFTRFTGREFIYDEEKYQILRQDEIFASIPEEMDCEEVANARG